MKTIFTAQILNGYRSHTPFGYYNIIRGHTGCDLNFINEPIPSPVTGQVVCMQHQPEMGNCVYIKDVKGNIHVFAHLSEFKVVMDQQVVRLDVLGISGNTGSKTTAPHLHYEVICTGPKTSPFDWIMIRNELAFKGYNRNPLLYLTALYKEFNVPLV